MPIVPEAPTVGRSIVVHPGPDRPAAAHWPHLDALRGIAALLVVVHHAHFECPPTGWLGSATSWMRHGHFLVTFFIILSGYCLTLPTIATGRMRVGSIAFIGQRARRLLPAYYAALAGSIALVWWEGLGQPTGRHWDFALPVDRAAIVTHVFLVHNLALGNLYKINHVFWSIAVEWQIYFAFPLLVALSRWIGAWWATALALAAGMAGFWAVGGTVQLGLTPHFYGLFALGMLASRLAHDPRWAGAVDDVSWWTLAALALTASLAIGSSQPYEVVDLPFGVACLAVLVGLSRHHRTRAALGGRRLVGLGAISYSLYLVHAPLQHLIVEFAFEPLGVPAGWEFGLMVGVGTPLIVGFAAGFYRLCERPFLRRRSLGSGPGPRPPKKVRQNSQIVCS